MKQDLRAPSRRKSDPEIDMDPVARGNRMIEAGLILASTPPDARTALAMMPLSQAQAARSHVVGWPGYRATPLYDLPALARCHGVARIAYKDEGQRFELKSFKVLGAGYAVARLVEERGTDLTVTCATDGNYGRAVAWAARQAGCRAVIFVAPAVSPGRVAAIQSYGAEVIRIEGVYEDAVRAAQNAADTRGWIVVSDTAYPGCEDIPLQVMHGYGVMALEVLDQWQGAPPTHLFLQAGVGGLAASISAAMIQGIRERHPGYPDPRVVVVEPERAACFFVSAKAGKPTLVEGTLDTICGGLACGEVSSIAWQALHPLASAYLTIPDSASLNLMRLLAKPEGGDPAIVAGESASVGLAGALRAASTPDFAAALALGPDSRILVVGSEGDTDPVLYREIVGGGIEAGA